MSNEKANGKVGEVTLKIDISKVYDRVGWDQRLDEILHTQHHH